MKRRLATICAALCLLWAVTPAEGLAAPAPEETAYCVNPLYADVVTEADLLTEPPAPALKAPMLGTSLWNGATYYTSMSELAPYVRGCMTARQGTIEFFYATAEDMSSRWGDFLKQLLDASMAHTGVPTEGDYLRWQYAGAKVSAKGSGLREELYRYDVTVTMTYYTTAAQEAEVDAFVEAFLARPDVAGAADYEKIRAIYDWLCENVYYDWDNYVAQSAAGGTLVYPLMYTAYGAAVDVKENAKSSRSSGYDLHNVHTAVCQGYGVLLYRLALECGLDARLIAGAANGAHAWNMVELEGGRYLLDATWDAHETPYRYFLRGSDHFTDHRPYVRETVSNYYYDDTYDYALLGISAKDYVPLRNGDLDGDGTVTVIDLQALFACLSTGSVPAVYAGQPERYRLAADCNGDGAVNILDYQVLYEAIK